MKNIYPVAPLLVLSTVLFAATFSVKADSVKADEWHYTFTPYVWATNLDTTAGNSNSVIDFNDLLSILDAAWMSMFEAQYGNWTLMNDVVYMKISDDASASRHGQLGFVSANADARFQQLTTNFFVGYTPDNSNTTVFAGLRYIYLKADADVRVTALSVGSIAKNGSRDEDWFDPVIGVRQVFPINDKWQATAQFDVGGGVESEFSSMDTITFDYTLTPDVTLRAGYRYARIDKDDHDLLFDQTADGVLVAAAWRF